jgi:hypothetical protein
MSRSEHTVNNAIAQAALSTNHPPIKLQSSVQRFFRLSCALSRPAVNRLVAGSNPARGAKQNQILRRCWSEPLRPQNLFGAPIGAPLRKRRLSRFSETPAETTLAHRGAPSARFPGRAEGGFLTTRARADPRSSTRSQA